jgi:transcription elongation factor Elf1
MDRREFGKPKRVIVAKMAAHCSQCGNEQFVRTQRKAEDKADSLFCHACGAEHRYTALLRQIADKVIARSDRLLKEAEALRAAAQQRGEGGRR